MLSSYVQRLSFEILVVAMITAAALVFAVSLNGPIATNTQALSYGLVIGALIHIAFELFGGNAYYCSFGAACGR